MNTFPVITNDSVVYLEHSRDLIGGGLVEHGYRQVGYPVALAVIRTIAKFLGAEPLLATAVLQRFLVAVAIYLSWRFWQWWSLPLVAFLVGAQTVAFTNFLLVESLAVSVAVLLVFPVIRFIEAMERGRSVEKQDKFWLGLLIVALTIGLYSLRFTYAVFAAVPLVLAIAGRRTPYRRIAFWMLGSTVAIIGTVALLTSLENRAEHGKFGPNVHGHQVRYYFAWRQVFNVRPENRSNTALTEFYDDGSVHHFSREVDAMSLNLGDELAAYDAEIKAMLDAAGIPLLQSRIESAIFVMTGGRLNDIGRAIYQVVTSNRFDVDEVIYRNSFTSSKGREAFAEEFNGGRLAEVVITDPIGIKAPPPTRLYLGFALPVGILLMLFGLAIRRTRVLSTIGLLVVLSFALGLGWIRADNLRFLMPTSAFGLAIASGILAFLVRGSIRSSRDSIEDDEAKDGELLSQDGDVVNQTPESVHPTGLERP